MKQLFLLLCLITTGCVKMPKEEGVYLTHTTFPGSIEQLPDPPPEISSEESSRTWGQEYRVGKAFAAEGDFFRAATCFHRARHLYDPKGSPIRRAQLVRALIMVYSIAGRPQDVIDVWKKEQDKIQFHDKELAEDTLSLLFEAYERLNQPKEAAKVLHILPLEHFLHERLSLFHTVASSYIFPPYTILNKNLPLYDELEIYKAKYKHEFKNPTTAALFNAFLPGAGYLYVGQYQTATTSFLLNALFIGATVEFFAIKLPAAAILSGGFETGWYVGGIIGAKLAADMYNQRLREIIFKKYLEKNHLFPIQTMHYKW